MIPARINTNFLKSERFTPWKRLQLWAGQKVFAHPTTILKMFAARLLVPLIGPVGWGITGAIALSVMVTGCLLGGEYLKHCGYIALGIVSGGFL